MSQSKNTHTRILVLSLLLVACGEEDKSVSLQDRFEAIYGYTDCKEVEIGSALVQPTWMITYHTYHGGYLDLKHSTFLDEQCETRFTTLNRWATFKILNTSVEGDGEIHLEIRTRRIIAGTNENAPSELPGLPRINCNIEQADDLKKEECKPYFDVKRYVTLSLTAEGLRPFKDIDTASTSEETRSTELASYILNVLDSID